MASTLVYDDFISGAALTSAITLTTNAIVIPYSNGQKVVVIEDI